MFLISLKLRATKIQIHTLSRSSLTDDASSETHLLELAVERNSEHGLQLSAEDKQIMESKIHHVTPERERTEKKKHLCKIFSVAPSTLHNWLQRIDEDTKAARAKRIFAKWLSCHTQEEIAAREGLSQDAISLILREFPILEKLVKPKQTLATHAEPEWEPPLYNVWKQQEKTAGSTHFGNSEIRWLNNPLSLHQTF